MTTSTKISCPKCGAVLRPAKPLPAGKSVKCPKCEARFVVGQNGTHVKKQQPSAPPPPVAPLAPPNDDDDEGGGGIYSVATPGANDGGMEINYAPDMSIRDLRGPAMTEIVNPTNKMIIVAAAGFLGWAAFMVILLIPILFPVKTELEKQKEEQDKLIAERKGEKWTPEPSIMMIGDLDLRAIGDLPWYLAIPCLLPLPLGMIYSGVLAYGAVKAQSLESREWGVASAIMAMIPLNAGGLLCLLTFILSGLADFMDLEGAFKWMYVCVFLLGAWGTNVAVGVWLLTILNKPHVIAGFEYVGE